MEKLALQRLFEDVKEPPSSPLWIVLGISLLLVLLLLLANWIEAQRQERRPPCGRVGLAALLCGTALANLVFAELTVPLLSRRIWLVLSLALLLAVLVEVVLTSRHSGSSRGH